MKQLVTTIVSLSLLLTVAACTGGNVKPTTNKKEKKMEVIHLNKEGFLKKVSNYEANPNQWKYEGDVPCIVDFYATWCGPCKMLSPIMDGIAAEYDGKIIVYKVDVDENQELAAAFGVNSIPTLLWVPMTGNPFFTQGAMTGPALKKIINEKLIQSK
jgi:thioredoxin 1